MAFKENLTNLRKNRALSQEALAEICNVSRQSVSKWETGQSQPDIETLLILANYFNISVDELISEKTLIEKDREKLERLILDATKGITNEEACEIIEGDIIRDFVNNLLNNDKAQGMPDNEILAHLKGVLAN